MPTEIQHFINGTLVSGQSGRSQPVFNPATGEQSGTVPLASAAEMNKAVEAARAAFPAWAMTTPLRRARILNRFLRLLEDHQGRIAATITAEHGKVYSDSLGEIARGVEVVEFATGAPQLLKGEVTENVGTRVDSHSLRQPLGVVAGITPFNFPVMVPMWMFPVALACGNCFILKVSEKVPSAALILAELLHEAGVPDGVFQVVHGDKEAVDAILHHPGIAAVSFVGSTPIAKIHLRDRRQERQTLPGAGRRQEPHDRHARRRPRPGGRRADGCRLRGGRRALHGDLGGGADRRSGRRRADREAGAQGARAEDRPRHRPRGRDGAADLGRAPGQGQGLHRPGRGRGAELVVDGRDFKMQGYEGGFFLGGSIFDRVTKDMTIWKEEIFGPVLSVARARDYAEAAGLIAGHEFANGTAIFTRDGDAAREFAHQVEVGMVGINVPIPVPMAFHSFGGWKSVAVRRPPHARARGRALLHPAQDHHLALAHRHPRRCRLRHADHAVKNPLHTGRAAAANPEKREESRK